MNDKLDHLLIDGKNLLYATAWGNQALSHDGVPTGGIFGFLFSALALWKRYGQPKVQVGWEGHINWRFKRFPAYKSNRNQGDTKAGGNRGSRTGDDPSRFDTTAAVVTQQPLLQRILDSAGIQQWRPTDGECDDVLFTLAGQLEGKVGILSQDRDLYQATRLDNCVVIQRSDDGWRQIDAAAAEDELGVPPAKVSLWKALAGDRGDAIPGVSRIGRVTAAKLVGHYGTVDELISASKSEDWAGTEVQRGRVYQAREDIRMYQEITQLYSCELKRVGKRTAPDMDHLCRSLERYGMLTLATDENLGNLCSMGFRDYADAW